MKVAITMPLAAQLGGAEMMLLHLLRANRRGPGMDYRLAFLEDGPMVGEVEALGYCVEVFPSGQLRDLRRYARTTARLRRWLRHERVDAAMSWMAKAHLYAGPAARLAGVPAVWWQHGIPERHWMDRLATRVPARSVFCCSHAAQSAQDRLRPARQTRIIHPAVDLARFDPDRLPRPAEARALLGLPSNRPVIGIVGRLQRWKGVHVFIEAAAQVAGNDSDPYFVVVGGKHALEPDYEEALVLQSQHWGLTERLSMAGYQADTALWMQAMDVVVHASVEPEPFGMVIIEAMALGKSVVASRAGGPLEIIEDGVDGLLVEPGEPGALAAALTTALQAGTERAAAARRKAERFGADRLADAVARNLHELCLEAHV